MTLLLTVLTGLIYPGVVTGLCQLLFPKQANGSLIQTNGRVIGSELIGQNFTRPNTFSRARRRPATTATIRRPPGGSNLGPTNQKLVGSREGVSRQVPEGESGFHRPIPADLLTTSASGLDPHLSPASAEAQAARVAKARGVGADQVQRFVAQFTEGRDLGFLGEPRVNVLRLNLALDDLSPGNNYFTGRNLTTRLVRVSAT